MKFIFFGTDEFASIILDELKLEGYVPDLIICAPDKPLRRNKGFQAPCSKLWAERNNIEVFQPKKLDTETITMISNNDEYDFFIVASYGLIVPQKVLNIPKHGTLNVHPSLLPQYRGASPIETAILDDTKNTGVTIMEMDAKMDHGPIVRQTPYTFTDWPSHIEARKILAHIGGKTLAETISPWVHGTLIPLVQNHEDATFTKLFTKNDAELELEASDQYAVYRRFLAFTQWIEPYFFYKKNNSEIRVVVKKALFDKEKESFIPLRVVPEGKKEIDWDIFKK